MLPLLASLALATSFRPNFGAVGAYPLLTSTPKNCVAVTSGAPYLRIILDRNELNEIETNNQIRGTEDQRRMADIRAQRAQNLLKDTSKRKDKLGCYINDRLISNKEGLVDWIYLVFYIFKNGYGRIWSRRANSYLKYYQYTSFGAHCGWCLSGWEEIETLSGTPLLEVQTYVR